MRTGHKFKKLLTFTGDALDQLVLEHPLFPSKDVPLVVNNEVTSDFGTGVSAICPAHDVQSLDLAHHYNLSREGFVNEQGCFTDEVGVIYEGLDIKDP